MKVLTSGIKVLDTAIFKGGIPKNAGVLIEYDEIDIARRFSFLFLGKNFQQNKNLKIGYFTADLSPYEIYELMRKIVPAPNFKDNMIFIDGHQGGRLLGEGEAEDDSNNLRIFSIQDLRDILEVHDIFREVMIAWKHISRSLQPEKETKALWVYDSLHTLLHFTGREGVTFIGHQMTAQKKHPYTGYFLIKNDAVPRSTLSLIEEWADVVLCFSKSDDNERFITIKKIIGSIDLPAKISYSMHKESELGGTGHRDLNLGELVESKDFSL